VPYTILMDFAQIALLLVIAAGFGLLAKLTKQPLLIGYLFAGVFIGMTGLISDTHSLESIAKIGVALLLFLLGLEMNIKELPSVGKIAIFTGLGQIIFTSGVGFLIAKLLGYGVLTSIYIAVALTFSSTIIIVKLLSEKKDLQSLYGRIAVGFLLVQDLVAVLILMFLSGIQAGDVSPVQYVIIFLKAIVLFISVWLLSKKVLPYIFEKYFAGSSEFLFTASIAWALGVAALIGGPFGFTIEIGGFLAGIALSNLPEHLQIASKVRPLRDFFLTIFFVLLGTTLLLDSSSISILVPGLIFALFVLIGNPVIVLIIMGIMGYKKRTSFMAGLTVAQISEFSFILMAMGLSLGHVTQQEVSMVILVGVLTMTISTYMILGSESVYKYLEKVLRIFERKKIKEITFTTPKNYSDHIVLVGCDRTGRALLSKLRKLSKDLLVVDFNPKVVEKLTTKGIQVVFGDINDTEVFDLANIKKASLIISTTGDYISNHTLLEHLSDLNQKPVTIFTSSNRAEASYLYKHGASYVLVPEVIAGDYIKNLLKSYGTNKRRLKIAGENHYKRILGV
jgi:predicted Kef-type K+ transport protein